MRQPRVDLRLDQRLVLNEWMFRRLGFFPIGSGMESLKSILSKEPVGWDEQNVFYFTKRLELLLPQNRAIDNDQLREYDRNIFGHWQRVTRRRRLEERRDIFPLYFQYLALLFTEYYIDQWSRDRQQGTTRLLDDVNRFVTQFNQNLALNNAYHQRVEPFVPDDLTKLAFWMATGSGKTLIMHCHIHQFNYYVSERGLKRHFNKYILITPNEGLTDQHLEEFELSGISAERYSPSGPSLLGSAGVEVIEITKLKEKAGVTTVAVNEFGRRNVVMVDEGHRGAGGDEWFEKRQALCSEGFSFEYSATFGQSVNSLSGLKQKEMTELYAKSVLFDYSYKFFHSDGYGKDFHILNYNNGNGAPGAGMQNLYLTACILRFYQQCKLFRDRRSELAPYLIEDPLMVFVGGSVTGQRQLQHDTDVVTALRFLADFLENEEQSVRHLDLLLRQHDEMRDDEGLVFRDAFKFVQEVYAPNAAESPRALYRDILSVVMNSAGTGKLHAVYMKGSGSEIGLRVGANGDYFGVINVGEPRKLWDILAQKLGAKAVCEEQEFSSSLFDSIKQPGSHIRLLIGARKFTEGWNCWRVSSMGLVNIGRKEGSQIIQLFGRGVRLKGKDFSLLRSMELRNEDHPEHIRELETLNVFGIRADYMKVFNDYIDEEDVSSAKKVEIICLPTVENLGRSDLKVVLPRKDMPKFEARQRPAFGFCDRMMGRVTSNWYPRLLSKTSKFWIRPDGDDTLNKGVLESRHIRFLDIDRLYLELVEFKKRNCFYNLQISREAIFDLLSETDWYELYIPAHMLEFDGFGRVKVWQEVATDLLRKYCQKLFRFLKDEFEGPYQEYRTIKEILEDPTERGNRQFLQSLRVEYELAVQKSEQLLIGGLRQLEAQLRDGVVAPFAHGGLHIFRMKHHVYEPLIFVSQGTVTVRVKPTHLNKDEKQFLEGIERWCTTETNGRLANRELYVLRNQSRGSGVSFFDDGNFSPDFIIWIMEEERQYIAFVDPHGLRNAYGFGDSKVRFPSRIKWLERERLRDPDVSLWAFIVSSTPYRQVRHWEGGGDKNRFLTHNILFTEDTDHIPTMFATMLQGFGNDHNLLPYPTE